MKTIKDERLNEELKDITWRLAQIQKRVTLGDIMTSPARSGIVAYYRELVEALEREWPEHRALDVAEEAAGG